MLAQALVVLAASLPAVLAQNAVWSQCGGSGWSGSTSCASGSVCTVQNPYYSQCIPGSASSTPAPTSSPATTISSSTPPASTSPVSSGSPNYWFSFGDSYTATGFSLSGTAPRVGDPLGNPTYPGMTGGGGANWIDAATITYNHSLILTYNFAVNGSTVDRTVVAPYGGSTLVDQVSQFTTWNNGATRPWKTSGQTIFSFWFGINDVDASFQAHSGNNAPFYGDVMYRYFLQVQTLYNAGARNFLFINVPPTDRSPTYQGNTALASTINTFNTLLSSAVSGFAANHTGVKTWLYDSHAAFETILNSPKTYGFVDATSYGAPGDFWGNSLHPSSAASTLLGKQISALLDGTVF